MERTHPGRGKRGKPGDGRARAITRKQTQSAITSDDRTTKLQLVVEEKVTTSKELTYVGAWGSTLLRRERLNRDKRDHNADTESANVLW